MCAFGGIFARRAIFHYISHVSEEAGRQTPNWLDLTGLDRTKIKKEAPQASGPERSEPPPTFRQIYRI